MTISLTGDNSFEMKNRLDELVLGFRKEYGDLAIERIEAEEAGVHSVLDSIQSLPFLAAKKMVVLKDLSNNKALAEAVEQVIDAAGDSTELIIYDPKPDKRSTYYKTLKKRTNFEEFTELDEKGLSPWLVEQARKKGGELSADDANYLVQKLGVNQVLLANELEKLIVYEPHISRQTIDLLSEPTPQSRIFDLLDAAFANQPKKALQIYDDQRAQKVEPQQILAMIAWQLETLTLVKLAGSKSPRDIAEQSGLNPYVIHKNSRLAGKITNDKLRELVEQALQIDYQSKTSSIDLDEALKSYLVTI